MTSRPDKIIFYLIPPNDGANVEQTVTHIYPVDLVGGALERDDLQPTDA